ncbi:MAG: glycosyltransferase [Pseudomonadota bacterium]
MNHSLDASVEPSRDSFLRHHPEWKYCFWDDAACELLIQQEYPDFLDCWINLRPEIKKWDVARVLILHARGGLYADIDVVFHRNLEDIFDPERKLIFRSPVKRSDGRVTDIKNHFIYSRKGVDIWERFLAYVRDYPVDSNQALANSVIPHTGGRALGAVVADSLESAVLVESDIQFLPHKYVINHNFRYEEKAEGFSQDMLYAEHHCHGSWLVSQE